MSTRRRPSARLLASALALGAATLGLSACQCGALPRDKGPDPKQNAQVRRPTGGYDPRNIPPAPDHPPELACAPEPADAGPPTLAGRPLTWLEPLPPGTELVAWPLDAQHVLLALRHDYAAPDRPRPAGVLWRVACAAPEQREVFVEREGADFGYAAPRADASALYFSDADGVGLLDLSTRQVSRITTAPMAGDDCWAAAGGDGETRLRELVVALVSNGADTELVLHRGGPCGFEGDWRAREVRIAFPADPTRRAEREPHPVSAVAAGPEGALWVADAGRCDEPGVVDPQTRGAVWRSDDGGRSWRRVPVQGDDGRLQTAAREVAADAHRPGHALALGAVCRDGGRGVFGGELFATRDGGDRWTRVPSPAGTEGSNPATRLSDVTLVDGRLDHVLARTEAGERFETRDLGAHWTALGQGPALGGDGTLVTVGADQYRATPDGLWWHEADEARRVFPPTTTPSATPPATPQATPPATPLATPPEPRPEAARPEAAP